MNMGMSAYREYLLQLKKQISDDLIRGPLADASGQKEGSNHLVIGLPEQ